MEMQGDYLRSSGGKIDSIPGNKQGEEITGEEHKTGTHAYGADASSMEYSDAHMINSG